MLDAGAKPDLNNGELVKPEDDRDEDEDSDSMQEKYFMEAFKNCATPLHVACVLGYDEIIHLLVTAGANVNMVSPAKGYAATHLAVLSNKPEVLIELLT